MISLKSAFNCGLFYKHFVCRTVSIADDVHATLKNIGFMAITVVITLNNRDCFIGNINDTICLAFEYLPITVIVVTGCRLIKSTHFIIR